MVKRMKEPKLKKSGRPKGPGPVRLVAMVLLVIGVGTAGLFTASLASLLVERYLRRRMVTDFETEDHPVLCNWSPRGGEAGPLKPYDRLILLSRIFLKPS